MPAHTPLSTPAGNAPRRWLFAGIEFDERARSLHRPGRTAQLQSVLAKLLSVLLAEAPRVVPRQQLLARVWNRRPDLVSRNVLSNAVARLRNALGDAEGHLIVAVPGAGYCLRARIDSTPLAESDGDTAAPEAEAERFMTRLWFDAFRGRSAVGGQMTLHDAVHAGIDKAEAELSRAPLVLACIHRTLAAHEIVNWNFDRAIHHCRRACEVCAFDETASQSDLALELSFELARVLANSISRSGDPQALQEAHRALAEARAMLASRSGAPPGVRLSEQQAVWLIAFYEGDFDRALTAANEVGRLMAAMPAPESRSVWRYRCDLAVTSLNAGDEDAAVTVIDSLWREDAPPLDAGDVVHQYVRVSRGAIYFTVGRAAEAVAILEPLVAEMRRDGREARALEASTYLARSLQATDRTAEALPLLQSAHAAVIAQRGATSESALEVLVPLTHALAAAGQRVLALSLLEEAMGPRVATNDLSAAGVSEAAPALARWIDMLIEQGDLARARSLLRKLRREDLQLAAGRDEDPAAFFERCRAAGLWPEEAEAEGHGSSSDKAAAGE